MKYLDEIGIHSFYEVLSQQLEIHIDSFQIYESIMQRLEENTGNFCPFLMLEIKSTRKQQLEDIILNGLLKPYGIPHTDIFVRDNLYYYTILLYDEQDCINHMKKIENTINVNEKYKTIKDLNSFVQVNTFYNELQFCKENNYWNRIPILK